jgi:hypothetical protein
MASTLSADRTLVVAELYKAADLSSRYGRHLAEIEVTLLAATDDYIHVKTNINDGSLVWAPKQITSCFLIYRQGRIEI